MLGYHYWLVVWNPERLSSADPSDGVWSGSPLAVATPHFSVVSIPQTWGSCDTWTQEREREWRQPQCLLPGVIAQV